MHHIHLIECKSTQDYLKNYLKNLDSRKNNPSKNILVSTTLQTQGVGRRNKEWKQRGQSLAFSFIISPNEILTLSSIEIGMILIQFLNQKYKNQYYLKWPNDILDQNAKKIAGIICHTEPSGKLIFGIGINFKSNSKDTYDYPSSELQIKLTENELESIPKLIYSFILENRISSETVNKSWNSFHFFQNKIVEIKDHLKSLSGEFIGISHYGEACIREVNTNEIKITASGTLRPIEED